ncbi:TetR/AcrR family transcriptional regulator [Mycobacteroides sp. LB1]|uniref:TetR/AcrR family transcriptional regulator n=1 Tax=Mycobacteroides sp. LB1 TaxID=2750814 RepID=UPI0015DE6194|nr:TetR/AcrR family transcriptional regulator [Mycobacteroides sp. LB1]
MSIARDHAPTESAKPTRRRLSVQARRLELLEIGADLLGTRPYEGLGIEQVAEAARISNGLLYHYFGNKREFFLAVVANEANKLLEATRPHPELPATQRFLASLDGYLEYVDTHRRGYRALYLGALGAEGAVRAIMTRNQTTQRDRILSVLSPDQAAPAPLRLAVQGWIAFLIAVCLDWLDDPSITREELRDQCVRTLRGVIAAADTKEARDTRDNGQ